MHARKTNVGLRALETRRTAEGQVSSRGVLRLALGRDREKRSELRGSPAGRNQIAEAHRGGALHRWRRIKPNRKERRGDGSPLRRVCVAVGEQAQHTTARTRRSAIVQGAVPRGVGPEQPEAQHRGRQQGRYHPGGNETIGFEA